MSALEGLEKLGRERPEWTGWLGVVAESLRAIDLPEWDRAAPPSLAEARPGVPLLANTNLALEEGAVSRLFERLVRAARAGGAPKISGGIAAGYADGRAMRLMRAILNADDGELTALALEAGEEESALRALAQLLPIPYLQACQRRWSAAIRQDWAQGYCPVCGSWPAYAEARGIERNRYLRCGGCGAAWAATCLSCSYCGTTDHKELGSLVPEQPGAAWALEVCRRCLGYLKVHTTLRGSDAARVALHDLASIELDVAAAYRGHGRPHGRGYALGIVPGGGGWREGIGQA